MRRQAEALEAEAAHLRERLREASATAEPAKGDLAGVGRQELFAAFGKTRLPMILTDPNREDDPIIFVNRAFEELSGYASDELIGRNCRFLQGKGTDPERVAEIREALAAGRDVSVEILNYRRDGTPFPNELFISPVHDRDGRLLYHFGSQLDVTNYRADRRKLETSERRQRDIFDSTTQFAIVATDREGRVTDWNTGAERILGWTADEMLGRTVERLFTPEDREAGRPEVEMYLARERGRGDDERWHVRKNGNRFWASGEMMPLRGEDGAHAGYVKVLRDRTEEHRAGLRLAENEERYRTLFESIGVGFCIVRMRFDDDGRAVDYLIEEANPAFVAQTGADVAGRWVGEFAPDLERHWFDRYGRVALTGEPAHFEHYADVFGRWFDVRALRTGDPAAHRVAIFFSDITERRQVERRAEAGERELRLIADALPVLIAFIGADHVYRFANKAYEDWFFLTAEEVVGRDVRELLGPKGYAARKPYLDAALDGEPSTFELDWPLRDGRPRVAEIRYLPRRATDGTVDGFHVFVQDVTARTSMQAELERQVAARTAERDQIWQVSLDMLCVAYVKGYFVSLNPAWSATLGWSDAEMRARPFLDFVHPEDVPATVAAAARLSRGEAQSTFENRYRHKDGCYLWLSWNAVPRDDLIYASVRNVTEARRQAQALAETEEALRQSQKMEAVGQLTGGLAHDFNNLLAGISGSLELMQTRMTQGRMSDLDRYMTVAQGAAKRAAALTHRLLAFSRRQTLDPKPTNVNRLVTDMEELVRRTVGPAIHLEVVGLSGLWPALIDAGQLENALLNLCINARDAMPDGGHITIETANKWLDDSGARQHDMPPGQYLSVCVTDTGAGMSPELMGKVFEPFFTTKPLGEGTGLGLSMVYGFAKQSGGQVRLYSEVGVGTTVCLYLPRHYGEADEAATEKMLGEVERAEQGETVLVVDDEPSVRMLVTEVLEDLGYTAIEAADSVAGLKVLQSDVRIDLLVTDVGLPGGMNGRQMAEAALPGRPSLKVLFITGYAENAILNHGHLGHGMHVMTKPFTLEALATRIRGLIEG